MATADLITLMIIAFATIAIIRIVHHMYNKENILLDNYQKKSGRKITSKQLINMPDCVGLGLTSLDDTHFDATLKHKNHDEDYSCMKDGIAIFTYDGTTILQNFVIPYKKVQKYYLDTQASRYTYGTTKIQLNLEVDNRYFYFNVPDSNSTEQKDLLKNFKDNVNSKKQTDDSIEKQVKSAMKDTRKRSHHLNH